MLTGKIILVWSAKCDTFKVIRCNRSEIEIWQICNPYSEKHLKM